LKKSNTISTRHNSIRFYSNESNSYSEQEALWKQFTQYLEKTNNHAAQNETINDNTLTHLDQVTNLPKQVDISIKPSRSVRVACATGYIQLDENTFNALVENKLKKGNALIVAQLAGIQASKQTAMLIPLCHQLQLDVCEVKFVTDRENLQIKCEAICKTVGKTGVEMEALTACSVALLTIYDMCKAMQKDASINNVRLEYKTGGKSDFKRI
jgi:cyclic pyranopterin phosphate synthase